MNNLTFITGNPKKAEQVSKYLDYPVTHHKLDLPEIQTLDIEELVAYKAKEAFTRLQTPVLIEDNWLVFNAFGKLPGPFVKWFLQEIGTQGLCDLLEKFEDWSAKAIVLFGLYDGKELKTFLGEIDGEVVKEPRGDNGFGWDPIFVPIGYNQTRGQMNEEDYDKTSPRNLALQKLLKYLKQVKG
jgi:non-canonical purine NTP pyrophosphatase (RdgB/HAM1 family)